VKFYTPKIKKTRSFNDSDSAIKIEIVVRVDKSDSDHRKRRRNFADFVCRIHIFSATLLIYSQAEKTRDIVGSMSVFTREWVSSIDLSCFTDQTYIGGRSHSSTTDRPLYVLVFTKRIYEGYE